MSVHARYSRIRGAALGLAACTAAGLIGPAAGPADSKTTPPRDAPCAGADVVTVDRATKRRAVTAVRCLVNRLRAQNDRERLTASKSLSDVATRHSRSMQRFDYMSHTGRDGRNLEQRLLRSDYPRPGARFTASETVSWRRGTPRTPEALIDALRRSPANRKRLLRSGFEHLGVGLSTGVPVKRAGEPGVTLTLILARR